MRDVITELIVKNIPNTDLSNLGAVCVILSYIRNTLSNHILNQYERKCCQKIEKEKCRKCDYLTANKNNLKVHVESV